MVPPVQVSPLIKVNQVSRPPLGARLRVGARACDPGSPGPPPRAPVPARAVPSLTPPLPGPTSRVHCTPATLRAAKLPGPWSRPPPLTALSPQLGRYSALFLGVAYGAKRYSE